MYLLIDLVVIDLFLVFTRLLLTYQSFLFAYEQVSYRERVSNVSPPVPLSDNHNFSW